MTTQQIVSALTIVLSTLLGLGLGYAAGGPALMSLAATAFIVQWLAFVPACRWQTEHFYDLAGSLTYALLVTISLLNTSLAPLKLIIAAMVLCWCTRLGWFLFRRVRRDGKDGRFDAIKTDPWRFLLAWTLQGLWVFTTLLAALIALAGPAPPWTIWTTVGATLWIVGFLAECIADAQKARFRANPANRDAFIASGLWRYSRHPNYLGEMVLWIGMCLMAVSSFSGWQWLGLVSPLFVVLLITRVSGIPMLEQRADQRWGNDPSYQAYKAKTGVLLPQWPG